MHYWNLPVSRANPETGSAMRIFPQVSSSRNFYSATLLAAVIVFAAATPPISAATRELVSVSPTSLSFGAVAVGKQVTQSVVVTNLCVCINTISGVELIGSGFVESGPPMPVRLSSGQSVTIKVTFAPVTAGAVSGNLVVYPWAVVPLSGRGVSTVDQLSVSPASLNFGKVAVGETATDTVLLKAVGQAVTVSSTSSSNSLFAFPGLSLPFKITAGQSASVKVTFKPKAAGTASGNLTFVSNASNSHAAEPVTGTATLPYVSLSWNPSTSDVAGYNVYRGTSKSGPFKRLNASLDDSTSFEDKSVAVNSTFFYATTAVSASGKESGYSNVVEVNIP